MAKYIRTKEGNIYQRFFKDKSIRGVGGSGCCDKKLNPIGETIIKQADTIEELCDGFWWENKMYDEPIFIPNYQLALDRFNSWKQSDKALNSNCLANITIYGSIYIKGKGWFHVAKMNSNGELELL